MYSTKLLLFAFISLLVFAINGSEKCVKSGEICGYSNQTNVLWSCCCDEYKCVTTRQASGVYCAECAQIVYPFECLKCADNFDGECGGPEKLECCPSAGFCVRTNYSDPDSFGRCIPPP